ncbi:diguanylate cyclase [Hydrococcus rivularis NIES-593]|uniref:Diguanylate cyclase n=1 Tax=Hydrococcus rivularis NIES-593 TaxID=1921803 RepID=A0A1U7H9T7_9CYAN|nr:EAL domain-containing protein [Hydrococcus rivularis]OKH20340.1 diguanylate cyclase [Hydrococcus rivularis NIES-593]
MTVDKAIDKTPPIVSAQASVKEAIALMKQTQVGCVLLVEQQKLVGILSERDVLKLIDSRQDWQEIAIAQVMTQNLVTLPVKDVADLSSLLHPLRQHCLEYLPIVTEDNRVFGLVTRATILQSLPPKIAEAIDTSARLKQELEAYREIEEELRINEQALQLNQNRLDSILSSIEDVVWSIEPYSLQLLFLNTAVEQVYGRKLAEFIENIELWREVIHPEDKERVEEALNALYSTGREELEYRILLPDGESRWIRVRARLITDEEGTPIRINGITTDITERHKIQEQLRHDAFHDGLTGLPNRNLLIDRLKQTIRRSQRRDDYRFALLFLDLDRFKIINDSLGHVFGDRLLVSVAHRLEKCQRAGDTVARFGGDEFVILLEEIADANDAIQIANRVQNALKTPILIDNQEIFVAASIGIVIGNSRTYPNPEQVTDLLRDADIAMYRAKSRSQGNYEVFDPSMYTYALKRLQLENDLRRAIVRTTSPEATQPEFSVYYQPIFSIATQQIEGFEALVRWQHPEKGTISPVDFIAIAEETGLIVPLDRWVLKTACYQLRAWQAQFPMPAPLTMSVNLSGKHFYQPGLIEFLDSVLEETGLDGSTLKLEITESIVIENTEAAAVMLKQLRDRKVQACLDDFGTGYSSLSYLHSFPFNTLKIDRSFIKQLGMEEENDEIVKAIVNLGLILRMNVVAEGVETPEQVAQLKDLNCHYGQGYWFSRPMNGEAMTEFLLGAIEG